MGGKKKWIFRALAVCMQVCRRADVRGTNIGGPLVVQNMQTELHMQTNRYKKGDQDSLFFFPWMTFLPLLCRAHGRLNRYVAMQYKCTPYTVLCMLRLALRKVFDLMSGT